MIPFYSSSIVKIVYFPKHDYKVDCIDGGYTLDLTRARMYDVDEPDGQILTYYDDDAEIIKVRVTVETYTGER